MSSGVVPESAGVTDKIKVDPSPAILYELASLT